jgi:hypothetical protein
MVFDRTPVPAGEMWRSAARYGFARGFERDPVSGHKWLPMADVAQGLSSPFDGATLLLCVAQQRKRKIIPACWYQAA